MSIISNIETRLNEDYHHISLWYFVAFIFGILLYFTTPNEPNITLIASLILGSLLTLWLRSFGVIFVLFSGMFISLALGFGAAKYRTLNLDIIGLKKPITTSVIGTVNSIKHTISGTQIVLDNTHTKKYHEIHKVRINIKAEHSDELMIGDRIKVFAFLNPPPRSVLPGGYDFGLYAYFSGLQATGYGLSKPLQVKLNAKILSDLHNKTPFRSISEEIAKKIQNLRHKIYNRVIKTLDPIRGNFAAAILLGEGSGLDRKVMQNMRYAGVSHILCVSGLHLSLVAMLFFITSRFLLNLSDKIAFRFNIKAIAAFISLIGSFAYLLISGMQIAATRAFVMTAIFILSVIIGRSPYPLRSICVAAAIILSINPEYVLHPSFQLSFIAVLSLITGYEFYIRNQWILGDGGGLLGSIKLYIFSNIYSSMIASLATTPIVIYHFYISSNYSIIANLIAVPIMSFFMMPLAILAVILMPFSLDYYILKLLDFFIQIVINLAEWVCHQPGAIWYFGYITPLSLTLYIIGFFWLTLWQKAWRHYGWFIILIAGWMMFIAPKPDVIFDPYTNTLGVKNSEGKIEIYAKRVSNFTKNYWSNWFGQADTLVHKEDLSESSHKSVVTASGRTIKLLSGSLSWQGGALSAKELKEYGTVLVFCEKERCWPIYDKSDRFRFR